MLRRVLWCALLLVALAAPVAARSLVIQRFDVRVEVRADGSIAVTEIIEPRFNGKWNGLYRTIPVEYKTPQGFNKTFFLDLESVTDGEGHSLKVESTRERHYRKLKIWVPGAEDAVRTIMIRYTVPNALLFFEDHDELYWNITGDEWDVPIQDAGAVIQLPAGATGIRTLAFTGGYGSKEHDADVTVNGNEIIFKMRRNLAFREGLTAVVGWDKGLVREPTAADNAGNFLRSNWPLVVPIVVFGLMYWLWNTRGRDPRLRPIAARYDPPEGLTPAEVGTLCDNSADMRDITATLVDLAVRGYILIEEKKEEQLMGLFSNTEYVFHLRKSAKEWGELKAHERRLLDGLFTGGGLQTVKLSDLENKFYKELPGIKDRVFDALMARKYYAQRPDKVKAGYLIGGVIIGFGGFWAGGMLAGTTGMQPAPFMLAAILSALIVCGFGWFMPARTLKGSEALEGVLGFEEFLGRVEADRYDRMVKTPQLFEKYLPFAMALGVEKNWTKAFEGICNQPPDWYRGGDFTSFRTTNFVNNLNRMSTQAASSMASAPRSSGSSGFGGGGSSGGGGGGGGGGGF
ncbi:MAG: DUF2207 domain-containing protein [Acidobacteria bacterium]|nr:DUF2207 domain-containing protein [Acidobacteriota bacterium]MCL5286539.1 DUF2207 domain-containing protein [Acidobacteriota bacterium]